MRVVVDYPPNFGMIKAVFPDVDKAIFAYGDTIYNPWSIDVTKDKEIHEEVHSIRQGALIEEWWYNYLKDRAFRLDEEIRAYGTQYHFILSLQMLSKIKEWKLDQFADALSGPTYGNLLTFNEARSKIRNFAKNL